jgi:hypothetical protein
VFFLISIERVEGPVFMMTVCFLVAVIGLIYQYHQYQMITDFYKRSNDVNFPIFLFIGTMTVAGGAVRFGRPYKPFFVSFAGVIASVVIYLTVPGLTKWFEKTMVVIVLSQVNRARP